MKQHYQLIQDEVMKQYGYSYGFIDDLKAMKTALYGRGGNKYLCIKIDEVLNVIILLKSKAICPARLQKINPGVIHNHSMYLAKFMELAKVKLTVVEVDMYKSAFIIASIATYPFYKSAYLNQYKLEL